MVFSTSLHEKLLIIDFGSQFTQLIARRVREIGVYCEIHPFHSVDTAFLTSFQPKAVILSGGPASTTDAESPVIDPAIWAQNVPILGICYGHQALCAAFGGRVEPGQKREFGRADIHILKDSLLFQGLGQKDRKEIVWMSHGDKVIELPQGFEALASSSASPYAAIGDAARRIYGVQFHPEVTHTAKGLDILKNFTHTIAGFQGDWTMTSFREEAISAIRNKVGKGRVLCGLSGGVDSSVTAMLIHQAIGERLVCVFVDTGLMRKGEALEVVKLFRDHHHIPLVHIKAEDLFLAALKGVRDPEVKRKTIGRLFVEIFEKEAENLAKQGLGPVDFLAQGTLYPDVVESVSMRGGPSVTIKSHHNVGGLPEKMQLKILEPLRELFKDEVRILGRELGLSKVFVDRHPFPGPGLAIRILDDITLENVALLQEADAIFLEEIRASQLYDEIWQAFCVLLPVKTVGVMGDGRTYERVLALRAVTSIDGMTADAFPYPWDLLLKIATRIVNEVKGINRVVYDITSKPPGTIEWE